MKKKLCLVISIIFCISILISACGSQGTQNPAQSTGAVTTAVQQTESTVSEPGTYPLVKEKINLTVFAGPAPWIKDLETNAFTKWYEEKTNVHIEWMIEKTNPTEKLNLLLASNTDLPEVITGYISSEQLITYGSKGVFLSLNDLIDKYGVETKKLFDSNKDIAKVITAPDGKIYGLPYYTDCLHCVYGQKAFINTKWLEKLNLKVPTTTDEFEAVLKAFKTQDPNGNGKADEIPFSASEGFWHASIQGFLMSPFEYYHGMYSDLLNLVNDKVVPAYTTQGWKDGLKWINKLYKEGLIDPQAFTQDGAQFTQLAENTPTILGAFAAGGPNGVCNPTGERILDYLQWIPPLKGPTGLINAMDNKYTNVTKDASVVITNTCKNPEIALRWADGFYNDEINMREYYGEPGVAWEPAKAGDIGIDGKPAIYKILIQWGQEQNSAWCGMVDYKVTTELRHGEAVPQDGKYAAQPFLYQATVGNDKVAGYMGHEPKQVLPPLFMALDEVQLVSESKANIIKYVKESFARFVTGDLNIDSDWDKYIQDLDKMGLKQVVDVTQKAYERQFLGK